MKKIQNLLGAIVVIALFFTSCEKDFNGIGNDILDQTNFDGGLQVDQDLLSVSTEQVNFHAPQGNAIPFPVQTDNLSYNLLGYYNDPIYGSTTNTIVSQVKLNSYGLQVDDTYELKKVVISVPYYSTKTATGSEGEGTYELDSIYGTKPIKLSMHRSDYFLNEFAPGDNGDFDEIQKFYSDERGNLFGTQAMPINLLEEIYSDDEFFPSDEEREVLEEEPEDLANPQVTERLTPRLLVEYSSDVPAEVAGLAKFNWLIDPINTSNLENESSFQNFYRGLYFKVENTTIDPNDGVLMGLDLSQASIEITYAYKQEETSTNENGDTVTTLVDKEGTTTMTFSGRSVTFFENDFNYTQQPDRLYLKGGEGSMVEMDILTGDHDNNGVSDLEEIKALAAEEDWLINEANMQFYVDENQSRNSKSEPERIMIFDIDNNRVLLDYIFDATTDTDPNNIKIKHLGRLQRDASGLGVKYNLSLTEHVHSLIKSDSTNVRLGLMLSNNISSLGSSEIKGTEDSNGDSNLVLSSSLVSHRGTVLYNEEETDEDKRLKLKIYYTKRTE